MVKEIVGIILGGLIVNNYAFGNLLGIVPAVGGKTCSRKALFTGLAITLVMLLTQAIAWPLESFVIAKLGLGGMRIFAYVLIVLIVTYLLEAIVKGACKESLGLYFPVIALNGAVLGLALNNAGAAFGEAMLAAVFAGLGYTVAMLVFAGVQGRIQQKYVPAAFRGLPASILAAAIVSMAIMAF